MSELNTDSRSLDNFLEIINSVGYSEKPTIGQTTDHIKLYDQSALVRKIVSLYPNSASRNSYEIDDETFDKDSLMSHFRVASIYARKFGYCYLILHNDDKLEPLKPEKTFKADFRIALTKSGDYYLDYSNQRFSHVSRTLLFIGSKRYLDPDQTWQIDEENRSVIFDYINAVNVYESSIIYAKMILSNLSNLTLGIKDLGMKTKNETGKRDLLTRLLTFDRNRRLDKAIAYDLEHESVQYINQTLNNVESILSEFKEYLSACVNIPSEKLFNQSKSSNLASGYQNSIVHRFEWSVKVKEWSEQHYLDNLKTLYRNIGVDKEITIPITIELSEAERAELEKLCSERDKNLIEAKIISPKEIRSGYEKDLFNIRIRLDEALYKEFLESDSGGDRASTNLLPDNSLNADPNNPLNTDSLTMPDDFWENLAKISFSDLNDISEDMINE